MAEPILEIRNLSKRFRSHWTFRPIRAVEEVTLQVQSGESYGFLGHNGAGKTTTIKCVMGLIHKTNGEILLEGAPLKSSQQRSSIGYLPEQPYFYDHLTVEETLRFFGALHGMRSSERRERAAEVLNLLSLKGKERSSVRALSKGLQQRLALAQAILNRPKLLILDEPFSGLDPLGRIEVRELLLQLRSEGTTIFMSSHILSDVEDICDRVGIMARGKLKTVFSLKDAPQLFGEAYELTVFSSNPLGEFKELANEVRTEHTTLGEATALRFEDYDTAREVMMKVNRLGLQIVSFQTIGRSLEDVFVSITKEENELNEKLQPAVESGIDSSDEAVDPR